MIAEDWDRLAAAYFERVRIRDDEFHLGPNGPGSSELRLLPSIRRGISVLDVGCGSGANSVFFARHGCAVVALDPSSEQLRLARERANHAGVQIRFVQAAIGSTSLGELVPRGTCDLVYAVFSLEYVEDLPLALREIAGALAPGGCFIYCDLHPAVSWRMSSDKDSQRLSYFDDGETSSNWPNTVPEVRTKRWHRSLSTIVRVGVECGLSLEGMWEPEIDRRDDPAYDDPDVEELLEFLRGDPYSIVLRFARTA